MPNSNSADPVLTHTRSNSPRSNVIHHTLRVGSEQFTFEEDSKVSVYMVNGQQIPQWEDAMIRALIGFRDNVAKQDADNDKLLAVLDREIDRAIVAKHRNLP